jgi:hypothetical protein
MRLLWYLVGTLLHLEQGKGASPTYCYTMYNEKALNLVRTWLPDFSALCHSATFGMASVLKGRSVVPIRGREIASYLGYGAQSIA